MLNDRKQVRPLVHFEVYYLVTNKYGISIMNLKNQSEEKQIRNDHFVNNTVVKSKCPNCYVVNYFLINILMI